MKKRVLFVMIVACLLSVGALRAQTTVTITAGGLATALSGQTGITSLKVNGTMDARDFKTINNLASTLTSVDLSGVTKVEAYQGTGGTGVGNVSYPANEIPERSFMSMRNLITVLLPSNAGITSIGFGAFNQSGITEIEVPNGVTTIGNNAFANPVRGQSKLKKVTLRSVVTLGANAFQNAALEEIILSNNLEEIGQNAFQGTNLTSISIPASVTRIESGAFDNSDALTNISFPEDSKLEWLSGVNTFQRTAIANLQLPVGTKIVDGKLDQFCYLCRNLTAVTIPANVTEIGRNAFNGTAIASIVIPDGVTTIGQDAFRNAPITSLTLSKNLTTLGGAALRDLAQLETLELPASLTAVSSIGSQAFAGMTSLKKLIVNNPDPDIFNAETNVFRDIPKGTDANAATLYVPAEGLTSTEADKNYKTAYLWKDFMPNIKAIGEDAGEGGEIADFDDLTVEVGIEPITLNASATGNRPVTYTIETGNDAVATLSGNVLTIKGEGTVQITAKAEGNNDYQESTKTITLTVVNTSWLEAVTILVSGNTAKVVGPAEAVARFTKFYVGEEEITLNNGVADLTDKTGELALKATTADGSEVIKLTINKQ
jgi:hypothetical protein